MEGVVVVLNGIPIRQTALRSPILSSEQPPSPSFSVAVVTAFDFCGSGAAQ